MASKTIGAALRYLTCVVLISAQTVDSGRTEKRKAQNRKYDTNVNTYASNSCQNLMSYVSVIAQTIISSYDLLLFDEKPMLMN